MQRIHNFPRLRSFVLLVKANGMILTGENLVFGENMTLCHTVHHKSRIYWPGIEPQPTRWQARNWSPEPWHYPFFQHYNLFTLYMKCTRPGRPWAHQASCTVLTRSFAGVKRPGRGVDHPPPFSAEIKERLQLYLYSPCGPSWPVKGWTVFFP